MNRMQVSGNHSRSYADRDKRVLWHPFTQMKDWLASDPLVIERAEGFHLFDSEGRAYIDGHSSLWVNVHGHNFAPITRAIAEQAARLDHSTMLGLSSVPAIELAEKLVELTPTDLTRVFYSDSGSTAVEIALKMSFQCWKQAGQPERQRFITFSGAYHGDTIGSVSIGGMELFHSIFRPLLFPTEQAYFPYAYRDETCRDDIRSATDKSLAAVAALLDKHRGSVAAVVSEPGVQGANGMLMADSTFLPRLRALCDQHDVHLILDEVATGFCRTEEMFVCKAAGIEPDFLCLAKGITGGVLPLAATMTTDRVHEAFLGEVEDYKTFFHGHSFTGNPIACAAAIANIDAILAADWYAQRKERQEAFGAMLEPLLAHPNVGEIRRRGWMCGIELVRDTDSREIWPANEKIPQRIVEAARQRGAVIRPLGNVMILMPPPAIDLVILQQLVDRTIDAIQDVLG